MQTTSDEALIGRIAAGDKLAMQVLFARHHVRVYRFVLRLVGEPSRAEDLISEVFLDVWRQADRFESRSQVSTWLLAIARNKALSVLRRRTTEELDEEVAEFIEDPSDNPEVAMKKPQRNAFLRDCLRQQDGVALCLLHRNLGIVRGVLDELSDLFVQLLGG